MVVAYCNGEPCSQLSDELQAVIDRWTARGAAVELRTQNDGRTLASGERLVTAIPFEEEGLTREEVDRRIAEPGGMTLAEFWRKLGAK